MRFLLARLFLITAMFAGLAGMANAHADHSDDAPEMNHAVSTEITQTKCCHTGDAEHDACPIAIKIPAAIFATEYVQFPELAGFTWANQTRGTQADVTPNLQPPIH